MPICSLSKCSLLPSLTVIPQNKYNSNWKNNLIGILKPTGKVKEYSFMHGGILETFFQTTFHYPFQAKNGIIGYRFHLRQFAKNNSIAFQDLTIKTKLFNKFHRTAKKTNDRLSRFFLIIFTIAFCHDIFIIGGWLASHTVEFSAWKKKSYFEKKKKKTVRSSLQNNS